MTNYFSARQKLSPVLEGSFPNSVTVHILALDKSFRIIRFLRQRLASGLLFSGATPMRIVLMPPDGNPAPELASGALSMNEVLEGDKEFLEALTMRLDEVVGKPKGRFVFSYVQGQPGARRPPRIR
jgi:hypothetical protein